MDEPMRFEIRFETDGAYSMDCVDDMLAKAGFENARCHSIMSTDEVDGYLSEHDAQIRREALTLSDEEITTAVAGIIAMPMNSRIPIVDVVRCAFDTVARLREAES